MAVLPSGRTSCRTPSTSFRERPRSLMMLADQNIQKFLGGKQIVVLATVQADGAPLAMPMWFLHNLGSLTMISVENTQKVRNLRREPRVCVVAEAVSDRGEIQ